MEETKKSEKFYVQYDEKYKKNLKGMFSLKKYVMINSSLQSSARSCKISRQNGGNYMEYEKFVDIMRKKVENLSENGTKVIIMEICKNNGVKKKGLMVKAKDCNMAPTVYLEEFYLEYKRGKTLEEIAEAVVGVYRNNESIQAFHIEDFKDFRQMKSQLVFRVINYEKNAQMLKSSPYITFLDLAIVPYVSFPVDGHNYGSVLVKHEHLDIWGITPETVMKIAAENTPKLLQPQIRKMEDTIRQLIAAGGGEERIEYEMFLEEMEENENKVPMYVLTNPRNLYGASCMVYDGVLEMFAEEMGEDIYILPSSIHEVILLPASKALSSIELRTMVREINMTQIPTEEVLSDHVYKYSVQERGFCMI